MKHPAWEGLKRYVPEADVPVFNALRNSQGEMVSIPVTLYLREEKQLHADVYLLQIGESLYPTALAAVLEFCAAQGHQVEWDAVAFTSKTKLFSREEVENVDRTSPHFQRYRKMNLADAVVDAYAEENLEECVYKIAGAMLSSFVRVEMEAPPKKGFFKKLGRLGF